MKQLDISPLAGALGELRLETTRLGGALEDLFDLAQKQTKVTARLTRTSIRRALADFDKLERLNFGSVTASTTTTTTSTALKTAQELKQTLGGLDLRTLLSQLDLLTQAASPLTQGLFSGLHWAWLNVLQPMGTWTAGDGAQRLLQRVGSAMESLSGQTQREKPHLNWLVSGLLRPMEQWSAESLVTGLGRVGDALQTQSPLAAQVSQSVSAMAQALREAAAGSASLTGGLAPAEQSLCGLCGLAQSLGERFSALGGTVSGVVSGIKTNLSGLNPSFQGMANSLVGMMNTAVGAIGQGFNAMIDRLNGLDLTVPAWVPVLGGKRFDLNLSRLSLPNIPYLAQGAVLPANAPFLAVVGDQKHGTNIEAPLATIQEAVAQVMGESMASQDTANALLRQILTAIGSITVGDDTIGRAARRYESRMALMGGVR